MKIATRIALFSVALLAVPATASEVGVMVGKQIGKAQSVTALSTQKYDAVSPTAYGIRGAYTVLNLKVAELGLTASYQPKAEGDLTIGPANLGKLGNEYVAIGAQMDWKFLVNLHVGLDLRREKLTTDVAGFKESTTTTRPWLRAGFGFALPSPVVKPFFRVEVSMATTKEDKTDTPDNLRKALAPEYQVGLYGGIRF